MILTQDNIDIHNARGVSLARERPLAALGLAVAADDLLNGKGLVEHLLGLKFRLKQKSLIGEVALATKTPRRGGVDGRVGQQAAYALDQKLGRALKDRLPIEGIAARE